MHTKKSVCFFSVAINNYLLEFMSSIPVIHSWNLTNYARRINLNSISNNEFFWSCLDVKQTSLKMIITPSLQLMIISSDQCIEELFGNKFVF